LGMPGGNRLAVNAVPRSERESLGERSVLARTRTELKGYQPRGTNGLANKDMDLDIAEQIRIGRH